MIKIIKDDYEFMTPDDEIVTLDLGFDEDDIEPATENDTPEESKSLISYIRQLILSEEDAINQYEFALETYHNLDDETVADLQEILSDERDHIVMLTRIIESVTQDVYPDNGDE